jgi:hypothetical protein
MYEENHMLYSDYKKNLDIMSKNPIPNSSLPKKKIISGKALQMPT